MDTLGTTTEGYLRAASMAVAFYDYLITLPIEYRVYRSQPSPFRMSLACILFILIRYISVLVMITSNYGYFATVFTTETCRHFYFIPPMFKVLQSMVSHAILGVRTFNVAGRNKRAGTFLLVYYVITVGLEWFFDLFHRISSSSHGNCISGVQVQYTNPTTWLFYLFAMAYDLVTLVISTIYLLRYKTYSGKFSLLIRVMITDGLIFFVVLTIVNMLNLFLYRQSSVAAQSTGSTLAYAVVWIMSQRILIHLRELVTERQSSGLPGSNILPTHSQGAGISRHHRTPLSPLRPHFALSSPVDQKGALHNTSEINVDLDYRRPPSPPPLQHHHPFSSSAAIVSAVASDDNRLKETADRDSPKSGLNVQVHVERSLVVNYRNGTVSRDAEDAEGTSEDMSPSRKSSNVDISPTWR